MKNTCCEQHCQPYRDLLPLLNTRTNSEQRTTSTDKRARQECLYLFDQAARHGHRPAGPPPPSVSCTHQSPSPSHSLSPSPADTPLLGDRLAVLLLTSVTPLPHRTPRPPSAAPSTVLGRPLPTSAPMPPPCAAARSSTDVTSSLSQISVRRPLVGHRCSSAAARGSRLRRRSAPPPLQPPPAARRGQSAARRGPHPRPPAPTAAVRRAHRPSARRAPAPRKRRPARTERPSFSARHADAPAGASGVGWSSGGSDRPTRRMYSTILPAGPERTSSRDGGALPRAGVSLRRMQGTPPAGAPTAPAARPPTACATPSSSATASAASSCHAPPAPPARRLSAALLRAC